MFTNREAEISQLRAIAAGRPDAVAWSPTADGSRWTGFPALGVALLHRVWDGTREGPVEYGGVAVRASRSAHVERTADPYEALAALARLGLDMAGVPARPPSGGPALRVVPAGEVLPAAERGPYGEKAPLRPAG